MCFSDCIKQSAEYEEHKTMMQQWLYWLIKVTISTKGVQEPLAAALCKLCYNNYKSLSVYPNTNVRLQLTHVHTCIHLPLIMVISESIYTLSYQLKQQ